MLTVSFQEGDMLGSTSHTGVTANPLSPKRLQESNSEDPPSPEYTFVSSAFWGTTLLSRLSRLLEKDVSDEPQLLD